MAYRGHPQYYRSWNASALGLKTEAPEESNKIDGFLSKDRQRPRRESWSQPPQRGRGPSRGRGIWFIDNRPQNRRRNTIPDCQDYNYHANDKLSDYYQSEDNPILEEPRNLSASPESDYNDFKTKESDSDHQIETSSWDRKQSSENIYRPPKLRSASWQKSNSSSDDGSQSRGYSNGSSKKYDLENYKAQRKNSWERESVNNDPDQTWVHDKFEHFESDSDQNYKKDKKDKKDASTQVTPIDISYEIKKNTEENTSCEQINGPESNSADLPKEITIKFSQLMKESNDEKPESITPQTLDSKNGELLVEPEIASEAKSEKAASEVIPQVVPEATPTSQKEEGLFLINLDEDNSAGIQPAQPKISEDILALDWGSYQKTLIEEEIKFTMEHPTTSTPHKLDTGLKVFDSLL